MSLISSAKKGRKIGSSGTKQIVSDMTTAAVGIAGISMITKMVK